MNGEGEELEEEMRPGMEGYGDGLRRNEVRDVEECCVSQLLSSRGGSDSCHNKHAHTHTYSTTQTIALSSYPTST